jgi:hypothetical protein
MAKKGIYGGNARASLSRESIPVFAALMDRLNS